ncbi:hypothetical protein EDC01DRAFT_672278 [Geopyxis carbonaria]|nr:hypothetical protein EDC01DRAFT_672278 [Geopyxis carbonaria]
MALSYATRLHSCCHCRNDLPLVSSGLCVACAALLQWCSYHGEAEKLRAFYDKTYPASPKAISIAPDPFKCLSCREPKALYISGFCPDCTPRIASDVHKGDGEKTLEAFYCVTYPYRPEITRRTAPDPSICFLKDCYTRRSGAFYCPGCAARLASYVIAGDKGSIAAFYRTTDRYGLSRSSTAGESHPDRGNAQCIPYGGPRRELPEGVFQFSREPVRAEGSGGHGVSRQALEPNGRSEVERVPAVLDDLVDEVLPPTTRRAGRSERRGHTMEPSGRSRAERLPAVLEDLDDEDDSSTYGDAWEDCV